MILDIQYILYLIYNVLHEYKSFDSILMHSNQNLDYSWNNITTFKQESQKKNKPRFNNILGLGWVLKLYLELSD